MVRLLGLLKTLTEGGRPSVHQLAARFKTRRETIYRDLRTLQAIGYPIVGDESGLLSRPQLAPKLKTVLPPVLFTSKEVAALVWAVKEAGNRQAFRGALSTALPKVQALVANREGRMGLAIEGAVGGWRGGGGRTAQKTARARAVSLAPRTQPLHRRGKTPATVDLVERRLQPRAPHVQ
jgi:predicted DNA-binding transcriptional regulator YafY